MTRRWVPRMLWAAAVPYGVLSVLVGAIAGAAGSQLIQYAVSGGR